MAEKKKQPVCMVWRPIPSIYVVNRKALKHKWNPRSNIEGSVSVNTVTPSLSLGQLSSNISGESLNN